MQFESGISKYAGRVPPLDLSSVSNCRNDNDLHQWNKLPSVRVTSMMANKKPTHLLPHHNQSHHRHESGNSIWENIEMGSDGLPVDPRDWTRADVWKWLINMTVAEGLNVTPDLSQKFPMNGKALCLMSLDMYLSRVPIGGKMLYRDFRLRLARAMAVLT